MTNLHQIGSVDAAPLRPAGAFALQRGRAITLNPRRAGELRVVTGRVWATIEGQGGDHVLLAGERLRVPGDARLVIESWPLAQGEATHFDWDPSPVRAALANPVWRFQERAPVGARRQRLRAAMADWVRAWGDLAHATGRLVGAIATVAADNRAHGTPPIRSA